LNGVLLPPLIKAEDLEINSVREYIHNKTKGIYNSEGFFSSDLTSNTIQIAIDNLKSNSGTVWVTGSIHLVSTIHPRSYVSINFLGNTIEVEANVPVISYAQNTLFSNVKNAIIQLPSFYDRPVFLLDNNGMDGGNDAIDFNNIENIIINCEKSYQYTGIHMKLDGINEMWNNVFKNIIMNGPKTAILMEMTPNAKSSQSGGVGFSNGNAFDNICINSFYNGISFIKPSWYAFGGFNCNYFTDIAFQYSPETRRGITGVFGDGNTFMGISMNNWQKATDLEYIYQIYTANIKLYIDQWINDYLLFSGPSDINVLETDCPASFVNFELNDSFQRFDFSKRGVHVSNGQFFEQANTATIQQAIDSLSQTGGTIYVNKQSILDNSVYLKSNIELDFLGYKITLSTSSDGFIFKNGVKNAEIKNALISGYGGKNQDYFLFTIADSNSSGFISNNIIEHITMEGDGYTGIHILINGVSGIWNNTFSDIHMYKSNGISCEMTSNAISSNRIGWANGNRFQYICNDEFYQGIQFQIPQSISIDKKAGFNCNLFKHVLYQIEPNSHDGIIGISGDSNTFMHVIFWDDLYGRMNSFLFITDRAIKTRVWADWDETECFDYGINTVIETGRPFFDSSDFYWEDSFANQIHSFFLFPFFSKIISYFPMLSHFSSFFFDVIWQLIKIN
jgi:hypothetical protein